MRSLRLPGSLEHCLVAFLRRGTGGALKKLNGIFGQIGDQRHPVGLAGRGDVEIRSPGLPAAIQQPTACEGHEENEQKPQSK